VSKVRLRTLHLIYMKTVVIWWWRYKTRTHVLH